jgi:hypothetical protein
MTDSAAPAPGRNQPRFRSNFRLSLGTMMVVVLIVGTGLGWLARTRRAEVERQLSRAEIAVAQAELKRAQDRMVWSDRMLQKGYVSKAQNVVDRLTLQQKVVALEQARTKQNLLEKWFAR